VDGQLVARTVAELRAMPEAGDLLARLGRVVEAIRTVVGADGTGLTLTCEDGQPRWVATTDAAMQLLEEVQHDFGEGPCLLAYAEDRVVAVQDLASELVWDRIAVVVRQLQVRGVLSVPVRLADQPVGTLNVYATQPRAWSTAEVQALGAFAVVTAELVRTAVELANHQVEVAQLRQALASRVWIEQAKGMLAATEGVTLDEAFRRLRVQARSSSRKLAEVAQDVVQDVQRERVAAKALDDARVRAAEARAREAEQALQAAETGLGRRIAALDQTQDVLAARERAADQREHLADERDRAADDRNYVADARERAADVRDRVADQRDRTADKRDRDRAADQRHRAADQRDQAADDPE
jgi:ANTAR domain-containing protein/GAF domain-containing protein